MSSHASLPLPFTNVHDIFVLVAYITVGSSAVVGTASLVLAVCLSVQQVSCCMESLSVLLRSVL
jgi:hypothetical protein